MGLLGVVQQVLGFGSGAGTVAHEMSASPDKGIASLASLKASYADMATNFYAYLPEDVRPTFVGDAIYHQKRYLDMLGQPMGTGVLELGSDKPFISHFIRAVNPGASVETVSIDIPYSPYPITRVDIESQRFPFDNGSMTNVLFTEVLEHLFRDPAWTIAEINRVLAVGGKLFLTTPNACGYDVLVNLLHQVAPNGRNQFYEAIESGHPHLWTAQECKDILLAHGFEIDDISSVDYYDMPLTDKVRQFLDECSVAPDMNGQVLRIIARKVREAAGPVYLNSLFPQGGPVKLTGALLEWAKATVGTQPTVDK